MSDADPEDKVGDVNSPTDRVADAGNAHAEGDLSAPQGHAAEKHQSG